jgi:CobQ-like glutamine amidotransferase family enzyme
MIYIGGGQDRDQEQVAQDMITTKRAALTEAIESDAVVLAVCGGYQLLGTSWATDSGIREGLGVLDFEIVRPDEP